MTDTLVMETVDKPKRKYVRKKVPKRHPFTHPLTMEAIVTLNAQLQAIKAQVEENKTFNRLRKAGGVGGSSGRQKPFANLPSAEREAALTLRQQNHAYLCWKHREKLKADVSGNYNKLLLATATTMVMRSLGILLEDEHAKRLKGAKVKYKLIKIRSMLGKAQVFHNEPCQVSHTSLEGI